MGILGFGLSKEMVLDYHSIADGIGSLVSSVLGGALPIGFAWRICYWGDVSPPLHCFGTEGGKVAFGKGYELAAGFGRDRSTYPDVRFSHRAGCHRRCDIDGHGDRLCVGAPLDWLHIRWRLAEACATLLVGSDNSISAMGRIILGQPDAILKVYSLHNYRLMV